MPDAVVRTLPTLRSVRKTTTISLLDEALEEAKLGNVDHVMIVCTGPSGNVFTLASSDFDPVAKAKMLACLQEDLNRRGAA